MPVVIDFSVTFTWNDSDLNGFVNFLKNTMDRNYCIFLSYSEIGDGGPVHL